jgi:hypothetical protein
MDYMEMCITHLASLSLMIGLVHSMESDLPNPLTSFLVDHQSEDIRNWINPAMLSSASLPPDSFHSKPSKKGEVSMLEEA